ncbi:restriction endonuclease subunit S [Akkermansia muciniphila]|uniref:restriction endonuclease subunit S n=1 Tax=Akkermansia muciniphila TaxID=239935 RepID=UPI001BFF5849|nr:restriction endonuclease subunit S [Akkermansia muciniphila]
MKGLEITVKSLSEVLIDNYTNRCDSEFFKKEYVDIFKNLFSHNVEKLDVLTSWITQGPNPFFVGKSNIPCLNGRNINNGKLNYESSDYISPEEYQLLKRFQIKYGDILITLKGKGSTGKIAYVKEVRNAIFSRNIGIIRSKKIINPAYLFIFLSSKYGQKLIARGETGGTGQTTLTTTYLKSLYIPRLSCEDKIANIQSNAENLILKSEKIYSEAEEMLLKEIGLYAWKISTESITSQKFSKSVTTSRLDAEFYHPKYENYLSVIKKYKNSYDTLDKICYLKDENFTPVYGVLYKYIELSNIGSQGEITGYTSENGEDLPSRARRIIGKGDVIVSSIEGSLDKCALVTNEHERALCSTGFYVINSPEITPETLLVLFKSPLYQNILKRYCSGTILTAINKIDFRNLPIPLIDNKVQKEISFLIQNSFRLREESDRLLELAKKAVEIAIERGEETAMELLNDA